MRENGAEGCLLSHAQVASRLTAPYVVLEDDAVPTEAANTATEVVTAVQKCITDDLYDIIYLGGVASGILKYRLAWHLQGAVLDNLCHDCGATRCRVFAQGYL